jgi:hypothetical protein
LFSLLFITPNKRQKMKAPEMIECSECEGTGKVYYSCCGDDMRGFDIDLCPTCKEHCGDDGEVCESCNGTGHETLGN